MSSTNRCIVIFQMVVGDLPAIGALPHMSRVTRSVYAGLLRAHVEEQGWGDVVSNQASCRTRALCLVRLWIVGFVGGYDGESSPVAWRTVTSAFLPESDIWVCIYDDCLPWVTTCQSKQLEGSICSSTGTVPAMLYRRLHQRNAGHAFEYRRLWKN